MEYTQIPNLKEKVSRVAIGTWAIGGWMWGGSDENASIEAIHKAFDLGVNIIDTAPVYGFGKSEEIVGKAIKKYGKRDKLIIATKLGLSWDNPETVYRDSRRETVFKEIDACLKRLQTDYIDLWQVHWPDPLTPFEETASAMDALLKQGKIRAIGACNFTVEQMDAFQRGGPLHVAQLPFNIFENWIEQSELPYAKRKKLATLGYGALCRGLLTGKKGKDTKFKGDDLRQGDPKFQEPRVTEYLNAVKRLENFAKEKKKSLIALSIRWVLDKGVNVALWGARKPEQLLGMDEIWGWKLSDKDLTEIDNIVKECVKNPAGQGMYGTPPNRKAA